MYVSIHDVSGIEMGKIKRDECAVTGPYYVRTIVIRHGKDKDQKFELTLFGDEAMDLWGVDSNT